jgi:hypothetical protein
MGRGETLGHLGRIWDRNLSKVPVFSKIKQFPLASGEYPLISSSTRCRARFGGIAHAIIIVFAAKKRRDDF